MFRMQIAAHLAMQSLLHHEPYCMRAFSFFLRVRLIVIAVFVAIDEKYVEVSPDDVIWANLNINPYERKVRFPVPGSTTVAALLNEARSQVRTAISYATTAGLIILWVIPGTSPALCLQVFFKRGTCVF